MRISAPRCEIKRPLVPLLLRLELLQVLVVVLPRSGLRLVGFGLGAGLGPGYPSF